MPLQNAFGNLALDATMQSILTELAQKLEPGQAVAAVPKALMLDYDTRPDAQPVYLGSATPGSASTTVVWTVTKLAYESASVDARITRTDQRTPIRWTNRTDPTADGQSAWGF